MRTAARALATIALLLPLGACTTWGSRPIPTPGQDHAVADRVRVTRTDGSVVLLDSATIRADSVTGAAHLFPQQRVAISTAEIQELETRQEAAALTALTVVLGLVGVLVAALFTEGTGS
ncbi:MAG TPA: hypothetical protein VF092_15685 [Longimicrobium sp.]